jgi:hypothetical protein
MSRPEIAFHFSKLGQWKKTKTNTGCVFLVKTPTIAGRSRK